MLKDYVKMMEKSPTMTYVQSQVDAFHPDTEGVRVPQLLPTKTATMSNYYEETV